MKHKLYPHGQRNQRIFVGVEIKKNTQGCLIYQQGHINFHFQGYSLTQRVSCQV